MHCVIIGFALHDTEDKRIFDYETVQAEPHEIKAKNINPYLVDAPSYFHRKTGKADMRCARIIRDGNKPIDGGHYLIKPEERDDFLKLEPASRPVYYAIYWRRMSLSMAYERWCFG